MEQSEAAAFESHVHNHERDLRFRRSVQPSRQGLYDCLGLIKREEIFRPSKVGSCNTRSVTGRASAVPAQMPIQRCQDTDGGTKESEDAVDVHGSPAGWLKPCSQVMALYFL